VTRDAFYEFPYRPIFSASVVFHDTVALVLTFTKQALYRCGSLSAFMVSFHSLCFVHKCLF